MQVLDVTQRPPPGTRPGLPARASEVGGLPTLGLPALAGASGEAIDNTALSYVLQQHMTRVRKEEEKEEQRALQLESAEPGCWIREIEVKEACTSGT